LKTLSLLGEILCIAAAGYSLLALAVTAGRRRRRPPQPRRWPAVTVLKPLCGAEPRLYECLRSFCQQDYPRLQIVFGLQEQNDPARAVVRRLRREFPVLDIDLVSDRTAHGSNRKASNLANMMQAAKHDYLVLSDSDIHVAPDYLRRVVPPLLDPSVGTVTCLYRAQPLPGLWSRLSGLFIDDWFIPTVRIGQWFGDQSFASGATLALRRPTLDAIGGFADLANHLADDYMLSAQVRRLGLRHVLAEPVVATVASEASLATLLAHEARWMRTIRSLAPIGYNFTFVTMSLPLAIPGALLAWNRPAAWGALAVALLARAALRIVSNRRAGRRPGAGLGLLPIRGCLNVYVWCCGFSRSPVNWRGHRYSVEKSGAIHRLMHKE
jgi:ceramide glucosyltransferase